MGLIQTQNPNVDISVDLLDHQLLQHYQKSVAYPRARFDQLLIYDVRTRDIKLDRFYSLAGYRTGRLFFIWLSAQQAKYQKSVEYFAQKKSFFE